MSIIEHITLEERRYLEALRRVDRQVDRSTKKHRKGFQETDKQVTRSGKVMRGLGKVATAVGKTIQYAFGGIAVAGLFALTRAFRQGIGENMRFNDTMNQSLAIMGEDGQRFQRQMERRAREVRKRVNFELDELGEAYFFLASAGLDAEQSMEALLPVAEFAKAGMFDLATATDLATDAQSALGLTVDDAQQNLENMTRVTDVLVKANTLANASVQQFSESLTNRAAAALRLVNKDVEEGVAMLAAYADQGLKGREAGRAVNIVLRDLQRAWSSHNDVMREANVQVFDSEGRMRNLADIIQDLENALAGKTDEERRSTLSNMGFNEQSLIFLQTLIGTSESMREYEAQLRQAGGTSKEVAENQMQSLTQRFDILKNSIMDTFGEGTLNLIGRFFNKVEGMWANFERLIARRGDPVDEMIFLMRRAGADDDVIRSMEKQSAIRELENIRDELQENVGSIQIPVDVQVDEIKRKGLHNLFTEHDVGTRGTLLTVSADELTRGDVEQNIERLTARMERMHKRIQDARNRNTESGDQYARKLMEEMRGLEQAIEANQNYLHQLKEIEQLEQSITSAKQEKIDVQEEETEIVEEQARQYEKVAIAIREIEGALIGAGEKGAETNEWLIRATEKYEQQLTKLNNLRETGAINEAQFARRTRQATQEYLEQLEELYSRMSALGELSPEMEKTFEQAFNKAKGGAEETADDTKKLVEQLRNMADALDAINNVSDVFGGMSDDLRKVSRGMSSVIRNLGNIINLGADASGLDYLVPGLGIASGVATMISGMVSRGPSAREQQKRLNELNNSLQKLTRAVERNTDAFLRGDVVGGDIRQQNVDRLREMLAPFFRDIIPQRPPAGEKEARSMLQELEELFPQVFGGLVDMFDEMVDQFGDDPTTIIDIWRSLMTGEGIGRASGADLSGFEGIESLYRMILESFGEFGESLAGAITEFNMLINLGIADMDEAWNQFVEKLRELGDLPEEIIDQMAGIDPTTEEGKEMINELIRQMFEGGLRGDLSPNEFRRLLEFLNQFTDRDAIGDADEFSRSVSIQRAITEIQANEVISLLASILFVNERQLDVLRGEHIDAFGMTYTTPMDPASSMGVGASSSGGTNVNVTIEKLGSVSRQDIEYISDRIKKSLIQKTLYKQF